MNDIDTAYLTSCLPFSPISRFLSAIATASLGHSDPHASLADGSSSDGKECIIACGLSQNKVLIIPHCPGVGWEDNATNEIVAGSDQHVHGIWHSVAWCEVKYLRFRCM